jgi:hypothetical protein
MNVACSLGESGPQSPICVIPEMQCSTGKISLGQTVFPYTHGSLGWILLSVTDFVMMNVRETEGSTENSLSLQGWLD